MEFFKKAKSVQLKSCHGKYLTADPDEESVIQDFPTWSKSMVWKVEIVQGVENFIRFKSCYGKYLTASDVIFLQGMTGRKVVQTSPRELDSSVEWEPFMDGTKVKLKARYSNFLRANGGLPPWRNSITHDIPYTHHDWICWEVDITETRPKGNSGSKSIEILKSIVYGGLVESITSLSIVSSAAASETATVNIVALGLANVISGVFIIAHNLRDMKNASPESDSKERTDRYEELIGRKEHFLLHLTFAILSFLLFGLIPPGVYGLAFKLTGNNDYTIIAVAAASFICIILLSIGKAYCQGDQSFGDYFKTISYYVGNAVAVSGAAYGLGYGIKILVEKLGWFEPSTPTPTPATLFNTGTTPFIASS
ncbi:membrane protein of ER body 1-like [Olea europaea var. sylvestris]|nr:membrane protein of ER body 1-like [Olea europaea var. sylvestris]XP_022858932.1 membrane protein of ER body 1-like [Olea europaea var. sylvestris]XP_022858933.1 membrane protein of ER body 1-like [Olea europaea var. sylvestris]